MRETGQAEFLSAWPVQTMPGAGSLLALGSAEVSSHAQR